MVLRDDFLAAAVGFRMTSRAHASAAPWMHLKRCSILSEPLAGRLRP